MKPKRNRQNYTKEFRDDAVKLVIEKGYNSNEVGRRLGINHSNVSRWVRQYRNARKTPHKGVFPVSRLKPKTVVCAKKISDC